MSALARLCDENGMVVAPFFGNPKTPPVNAEIFVLMPFRDELKPVYEDHMCTVAKHLNLSIARADDFFTVHIVMHDVWNGICAARVVIADCTDRNPNVFYEIGLAHVVGKQVILLAQQEEDIPFDIRHIRCVKYQMTPRGMMDFERNLEGTLKMSLRL